MTVKRSGFLPWRVVNNENPVSGMTVSGARLSAFDLVSVTKINVPGFPSPHSHCPGDHDCNFHGTHLADNVAEVPAVLEQTPNKTLHVQRKMDHLPEPIWENKLDEHMSERFRNIWV